VLVNSWESLGFLSVFKAYHQIVSVPGDNDDREVRISFGHSDVRSRDRRWLDGSFPAHCSGNRLRSIAVRNKKPPACAGGSCSCSRVAVYRLAMRLAPPLAPAAWLPRTSPEETSLTQSEPLPL
jgi:hypothetical protein